MRVKSRRTSFTIYWSPFRNLTLMHTSSIQNLLYGQAHSLFPSARTQESITTAYPAWDCFNMKAPALLCVVKLWMYIFLKIESTAITPKSFFFFYMKDAFDALQKSFSNSFVLEISYWLYPWKVKVSIVSVSIEVQSGFIQGKLSRQSWGCRFTTDTVEF